MIWYYIVTFFGRFLDYMFSIFGRVDELPFGTDLILSTAVQFTKSLIPIFPFLSTMFTAVLIYISFRFALLVLRLFKIISF